LSLEESVLVITVLATLSYASISDLRTREVKEYVWVPAALISVTINLLTGNYDILQLAIASIPALLVLIFSLLDMMGGADFLALLVVTLAHPRIFPKPLTYLTLVYSLIIPVILIVSNLFYGLKYFRHYKEIKCVRGSRAMLLLLGRPKRVDSFLNSRFTYLLTIPAEQQRNLFECRTSFSMDDTYEEELRSNVRELLEKGVLKNNDLLWVTPGLPQIVFYLFGYVAALVTPESLLHLIISLT